MKFICEKLILFYKKFLSPLKGKRCVFTPTCSMYTLEAVGQYGTLRGLIMGGLRILRCNPLSKGGYDPVKPNLRGVAKWTL
jgi:putative membrane protein insertion efficiency factor